ncbi:hypothetical protein D9M71_519190 [compost metagenome]
MNRALAVPQNLHLDMAGLADETLQIDRIRTECCLRLTLGDGELPAQLVGIVGDANAAPAATGRGLDQQRIAYVFGATQRRLQILRLARRTRYHRHAGGHRGAPRLGLVAHAADGLRIRTDEDQPGVCHRFGEGGVFREESVTRVDRVRPAVTRRLQQRFGVQIAAVGAGRADDAYLVGLARGQRVGIRLAARRHGRNTQAARRADDAYGDLATVGNQQFLQHGRALMRR